MNLSKLALQLKSHEGVRRFPYIDTVGKTTIGVGRNLTDRGVSPATIEQMLSEDIQATLGFLTSHLPWWLSLDEVRQRALANLTFDLMAKILEFNHMLVALEAKDWQRASDELLNSKFAQQTGKRATDLAHMFLTGTDPNP